MIMEVIHARGHPSIRATHASTIEVTREEHLTERGDCIIGVAADKSPRDFSGSFKEALRRDDSILIVVFKVGDFSDFILAQGSSRLVVDDPVKLIIRRSLFVEPATVGIRANKAARDIDRGLVNALRNPGSLLEVRLYVIRLGEIESIYAGPRSILEDEPGSHVDPAG